MKITVVGGSKGTGAQVVRIAAEAGHEVTCLSRSGSDAAGVRNVTGDALDRETARAAVTGADAVVITVGGAKGSPGHRAAVTRNIIGAMQDTGAPRLVVMSSLGVGDSAQLLPRLTRPVVLLLLGRALADHAKQEALVAASGLDWTVVRPGGLADGPPAGFVAQETAEGRPMKARVRRADVARWIVECLDDPATHGRAIAMGTA
ncbi:MAG: NAD(P)H-binding protein [Propionibacteriaceae bacterium]|nr:NAD(P)H-binding protein [Propionibacteriaceae bacterium]